MVHSDRNSLSYVGEEIRWHREQARGDSAVATLGGWAYFGPLLILVLLWWLLTRVIGIPYAGLRAVWSWLR